MPIVKPKKKGISYERPWRDKMAKNPLMLEKLKRNYSNDLGVGLQPSRSPDEY